jgi:hypothetical protein
MVKCKICDKEFKNNLGGQLTVHLEKEHGMSYEDYYVLTELKGEEPKCKCGYCNERPHFRRGKYSNYAVGHNKHRWVETQYIKKFGQPKCSNKDCTNNVAFHRGVPNKYCSFSCHENKWNQEKVRKTVKEKYGVDNVFQLDEIKEKSSKTMLEKYGVEYGMMSEEIKIKYRVSNKNKYGVEFPQSLDWVKEKQSETLMKNHGVPHYSKTSEFRELASKNMCRYNANINNNHIIKKYKETELYYQSQYEYRFLEYCESMGLLGELENSPRFKYLDKSFGNWHLPDFMFRKKYIIEIKSTYWMNRQGGSNRIEAKRKSVEAEDYQYIFCLDENYFNFNKIL